MAGYLVPAVVQGLDADYVPDREFWPDGQTVGSVRDPFVDCEYCAALLRRLGDELVEERVDGGRDK